MYNATYPGSSHSSYRSGTSQSSTSSRETTSQVKNEHRTSVKLLAWMVGGPADGAGIRKTTTRHQGGPAQRRSSETNYEWVRKNGEERSSIPYRPAYPPASARHGSRYGGGGLPAEPRSYYQYGYGPGPGPTQGRSSHGQPPPPPRPAVEPEPPQDHRGQPPAQSRNPRGGGPQ